MFIKLEGRPTQEPPGRISKKSNNLRAGGRSSDKQNSSPRTNSYSTLREQMVTARPTDKWLQRAPWRNGYTALRRQILTACSAGKCLQSPPWKNSADIRLHNAPQPNCRYKQLRREMITTPSADEWWLQATCGEIATRISKSGARSLHPDHWLLSCSFTGPH